MARVAADVGAINVDAHRNDFGGVGDFVDVAQFRADAFDHAGQQHVGWADGARRGGTVGHKGLADFGAAQHAHSAPHAVIMHWCRLPRPPDEADDGKSPRGISVEQILLIMIRVRLGIGGE